MSTAPLNLISTVIMHPNMLFGNNAQRYSNSEPPELQFSTSSQHSHEYSFSNVNSPYSNSIPDTPDTISPPLGYVTTPSHHAIQLYKQKYFKLPESMDIFELREMEMERISMNRLQELLARKDDILDHSIPITPPRTLYVTSVSNDFSRSDDEVAPDLKSSVLNDATPDASQTNVGEDLYGAQSRHKAIQSTTPEEYETEANSWLDIYEAYYRQQTAQHTNTFSTTDTHLGHQYENSVSFGAGYPNQPTNPYDQYNESTNESAYNATYEWCPTQPLHQNVWTTAVPHLEPTYSGRNQPLAPIQPLSYAPDPNPIPQFPVDPEQSFIPSPTMHEPPNANAILPHSEGKPNIPEEISGHNDHEKFEEIWASEQAHTEIFPPSMPSMPASPTSPTLPVPATKPRLSPASLHLELGVSISEYKKFSENLINTNLKDRLKEVCEGESESVTIPTLGIVISSSLVHFAINPTHHPLLFHALDFAPHTDGFKYVEVQYDSEFSRVERATKVKEKKRGRPTRATAYQAYGTEGSADCYSCGRKFGSSKGMLAHVSENRGKRESCEVVWLQRGRQRCYFCDRRIPVTKDHKIIEEHTKVCKPLWELKLLIHPYHLEDTGLRQEEIQAFEWPGDHTQCDAS